MEKNILTKCAKSLLMVWKIDEMAKYNHCIIFIPGFKGSTLENENGDLIWPNLLRSQFSHTALNYNLPELGLPNRHHFHSTDIVKSIPIIPHIFNYDVFGHFINQLTIKFSDKIKIITFHYDWRNQLRIAVSDLNKLIIELRSQGFNKIDLLCHSMGGLIASYLLRYGNDDLNSNKNEWLLTSLINKVYLIATPFRGIMGRLQDLIIGQKIGLNHTLLSPLSLCTFPSVYFSIPLQKAIKDTTNKEWLLSDLKTWEHFKFGILNNESISHEILDKRKNYLSACLSSANEFHHLLNVISNEKPSLPLKFVCITSNYGKSLSGVEINEISNRLNWQYEQGDGIAPLSSTCLPEPFSIFESKNYLVKSEHAKMMSDTNVQEILWQEISLGLRP